jgi:ribosomal protein S18 acetylase RimI-like enzyme
MTSCSDNETRIRICRSDDLRALEWGGLFTHHREIIERTYEEQLAGAQLMLVAECHHALVAQVWIDLRSGGVRAAGVIWALRVHPDSQRQGLGRRLMQSAEAAICDRGLMVAELHVETTNTAARTFYERLGYVVAGTVQQTYSYTTPWNAVQTHCLDLLEMRKELESVCRRRRSSAGPSEM